MSDAQRQRILHQSVADLVEVEGQIEAALDRQRAGVAVPAPVAAAVQRFHELARTQRDALQAHLARLAGGEAGPSKAVDTTVLGAAAAGRATEQPVKLSTVLREDYTAFNHAAMGYAMLLEQALLLYDAPLRPLAQRHLRGYAEAAQAINQLIADVVAWELRREGLTCQCACPSCSLGACACVAAATAMVNTAWQETSPGPGPARSLALRPPRAGSPLASAPVREGDALVAIDGQELTSIWDINPAIKKHQLGEQVRLRFQRGADEPIEVTVPHVGDYPST